LGIYQIDSIINFVSTHNVVYTGGQFLYCPWCGKKRNVIEEQTEEEICTIPEGAYGWFIKSDNVE
jgi:hypothetical protein